MVGSRFIFYYTHQFFSDCRNLVQDETDRLESNSKDWDCLMKEAPESVHGDIMTVTGQARLLIRERFNQFSKLVYNCENNIKEKETTLEDLQGFWEMVYIQVSF